MIIEPYSVSTWGASQLLIPFKSQCHHLYRLDNHCTWLNYIYVYRSKFPYDKTNSSFVKVPGSQSAQVSLSFFYRKLSLSADYFNMTGMVLYNKAVLSEYKFQFPMFLTAWHMLLGSILTQVTHSVNFIWYFQLVPLASVIPYSCSYRRQLVYP